MIILYTNETCNFCKLAEDFLVINNIQYQKVSVSSKLCPENVIHSKVYPVLQINGQWLYGPSYHEIASALGIKLERDKMYYFDYAATTPVYEECIDEMINVSRNCFGNPSSSHGYGFKAYSILENVRIQISKILYCKPKEIYFTSGGTEANNLAIKGIAKKNRGKGNHIIVSSIEHKSILNACEQLNKDGFRISYINPNKDGIVDIQQIQQTITEKTILISIMMANNEVGVIQKISEIAKIAKKKNILFHTDAVQAMGHIPINFDEIGVDAMSISAHKLYGPKGVGILICKENVPIEPLIVGGGQENNLRSGTENVAQIAAMGIAIKKTTEDIYEKERCLEELKKYFVNQLKKYIKGVRINCEKAESLNSIINVTFENCRIFDLASLLDCYNIYTSKASACTLNGYSHVLKALNISEEAATKTIRFSLGIYTTKEDIDYVIDVLRKILI